MIYLVGYPSTSGSAMTATTTATPSTAGMTGAVLPALVRAPSLVTLLPAPPAQGVVLHCFVSGTCFCELPLCLVTGLLFAPLWGGRTCPCILVSRAEPSR